MATLSTGAKSWETRGMSLRERLLFRVTVEPSGCWSADLRHDKDGYATICVNKQTRQAHRVAYEEFRGPVPADKLLDHQCRNRGCINPWHVEPATPLENLLNSDKTPAAKTHCKQGHQDWRFDTKRKMRICQTCRREHWRRQHDKKRKHPIGGRVVCKRGHSAYAFDVVKNTRYCVECRREQYAARNERRRKVAQNRTR